MAEFESVCNLKSLSRDMMANVMSRLDGLSLTAATCTCIELQDVATERALWKSLCQATWPSTAYLKSMNMIIPYDQFYSQSYPLLLYDEFLRKEDGSKARTNASAADWMSFVDVYYKGKCVLSEAIDGISLTGYVGGDQKWFADCPFELEAVKLDHDTGLRIEEDDDAFEEVADDMSTELEEDVQLSWILLNKKVGKSVNVSSLKPLMVQKCWISTKNYTLQFGCTVPVDILVLPHGLAECVITARCELTKTEGGSSSGGVKLKWDEIRMCVKDLAGAHLGGKKTLIVMNQALYCSRSKNHDEVRKGYKKLEMKKKEMKQAKGSREVLANCFYLIVLIFAVLCHAFFM